MARWKINLMVLWFGQFMVLSGMTMVIPFLPLYMQELGVTDEKSISVWAGLVFASNFATAFFFQPLWGKIADRYGRKMMLLRSGIGMAICITLMGFSTSVWHLLLLRMLNGTVSGFVPAATALVSTNTPRERIGFAMGVLQSGAVGGTILGPVVGGLLAGWIGFRNIFYVTGGLVLLAALLAGLVVKERFDRKKAASQPKASIYQGFLQIKSIPQLPALFAVTVMIQFAVLGTMPQMPLYIQQMHGNIDLLAFYAGLVGAVTGFSNMMFSPILGRLGDRVGSERVLAFCMIGAAIAFIPHVFVHNIWQLLLARFFLGIFIGGMLPSVNALLRTYTPDGMESRAYSFNTSALALGNFSGPIIFGLLIGWIGMSPVFLFSSVLLLINFFWVKRTLMQR